METVKGMNTAAHVEARRSRNPKLSVFVEGADRVWSEHDADSLDHAKKVAREHINIHKARSVSVWSLTPEFGLKRAVFLIFDEEMTSPEVA